MTPNRNHIVHMDKMDRCIISRGAPNCLLRDGFIEYEWALEGGTLVLDSQLPDWRKPPVNSRWSREVLTEKGKALVVRYRKRDAI